MESALSLASKISLLKKLEVEPAVKPISSRSKQENFFELFTLIKLPSVAFLGHFTDRGTDFPTILHT